MQIRSGFMKNVKYDLVVEEAEEVWVMYVD